MKRRTVLKGALATGAALAMPSYLRAQSNKKISILTWNIADQEALFKEEFADFQKQNPGVEIEWLDKKGPEVPVFYQTQLVAGTPPDIINTQGALWVEYAANGALLDITPMIQTARSRSASTRTTSRTGPTRARTSCCPSTSRRRCCSTTRPCLRRPASPSRR
jgi:ABC-type glycerol-3-phosphate transport system substrate-binding protein